MKKALLITLGVIVFLLVALAVAPFLFKDKIRAAVDEQLAKNINGKVWYDADRFSLTVFSHFPNLTVSIGGIGLVSNAEQFKGDTLFTADEFKLELNLMSVITGSQMDIKGVYLVKPMIVTLVDTSGVMSWSTLTFPDTTSAPTPEDTSASTLSLKIEKWKITDALIIYDDKTMPVYAKMVNFNHEGSGDINADVYDLDTYTNIEKTFVKFAGVTYLNNQTIEAKAKMNINMKESKYTFMDNQFAINDFKFGFDGSLAMPADSSMVYDITYAAKETGFKNLLSLVPAVYTKDYDKIKTDGTLAFNGYVKGIMKGNQLPGFGLTLLVKDGTLQYPDLPSGVKNVTIDLTVDDKDGVLDHIVVDLKKFHLDMGNMPMDARLHSVGIDPIDLDANLLTKINLEEITKVFPVEGTQVKGMLSADIKAKGKYSDSLKLMPVVDGLFSIDNGYVKSKEFPLPLEQVFLTTTVQSPGDMVNTVIHLSRFHMLLDNEKFEANAKVQNLENIRYEATIKGIIDLAKMTKIYPIANTTLTGRINADITTKGVMSDVEAGHYQNTATSGTMSIDKLTYAATDFKQGASINQAKFSFTPDKMNIENMSGFAGKSDYVVNGFFANYMGYVFGGKDSTLRGVLNYSGKKLDVNEWMTEDETPATTDTAASTMAVVEVPKNLDFTFLANVTDVLYTNLDLQNFAGGVLIKDGILKLHDLNFQTLGGKFNIDMAYNTQNMKDPKYAMDLNIQQLSFKEAYKTFNTVKKLAAVSKNIEGKMDMQLLASGSLDQGMNPIYNTMNGHGVLNIPSAQLANSKVLDGLASVTKTKELSPLSLNNVKVNFTIVDGSVILDPFDVNAGDIKMNISGKNKLEGDMDYLVKMDVPTGALGTAAGDALSNLTGTKISAPKSVKMNLNVTGTVDNPKVRLGSTSASSDGEENKPVAEKAKEAAKTEIKNQLDNNAEVQKAKAELEAKEKEQEEQLKKQAQDEIEKKAKSLFKF
ncbi:MAG: tolA [Chitinophagaceae bacterium]|nr:tolA [Chitinophagaceae bacterium]